MGEVSKKMRELDNKLGLKPPRNLSRTWPVLLSLAIMFGGFLVQWAQDGESVGAMVVHVIAIVAFSFLAGAGFAYGRGRQRQFGQVMNEPEPPDGGGATDL